MDAGELLKEGRLADTLARLQEQVRKEPAKAEHRVFLFQLLCLMGQWDRALTQLNVAADLNPANLLMAEVCRPALVCEVLRSEIFQGKRSPLVLGEPADWVGRLIQATHLLANNKIKESAEMRAQAFEDAPAIGGSLNGQPFEWIADADSRIGPVIEAIMEGKYYWIPLSHVRQISMEPPVDLRDLVWTPALFMWNNGGSKVALIPTRYPGSERADDDQLRLARRTDWEDRTEDTFIGLGQRMFATDSGEHPLLEIRKLVLGEPLESESADGV